MSNEVLMFLVGIYAGATIMLCGMSIWVVSREDIMLARNNELRETAAKYRLLLRLSGVEAPSEDA